MILETASLVSLEFTKSVGSICLMRDSNILQDCNFDLKEPVITNSKYTLHIFEQNSYCACEKSTYDLDLCSYTGSLQQGQAWDDWPSLGQEGAPAEKQAPILWHPRTLLSKGPLGGGAEDPKLCHWQSGHEQLWVLIFSHSRTGLQSSTEGTRWCSALNFTGSLTWLWPQEKQAIIYWRWSWK